MFKKLPASKKIAGSALSSKRSVVVKKAVVVNRRVLARSKPNQMAVGGYTVFDSPVEPKHLTREQIAEAIASLD